MWSICNLIINAIDLVWFNFNWRNLLYWIIEND